MALPNLSDYNAKKVKGLISVQKIDENNFAIGTKQFSSEDGVELSQQVIGVTLSEVEEAINKKKAEIAELEAFAKDLAAAQ
jgi:hypothetical protein